MEPADFRHSGGPPQGDTGGLHRQPERVRAQLGGELIHIPEQQAAIRRILKLRDRGWSSHHISAELAEDGIALSQVSVLKVAARAEPSRTRAPGEPMSARAPVSIREQAYDDE